MVEDTNTGNPNTPPDPSLQPAEISSSADGSDAAPGAVAEAAEKAEGLYDERQDGVLNDPRDLGPVGG